MTAWARKACGLCKANVLHVHSSLFVWLTYARQV